MSEADYERLYGLPYAELKRRGIVENEDDVVDASQCQREYGPQW